jgi:hypothetical protein
VRLRHVPSTVEGIRTNNTGGMATDTWHSYAKIC